MWGDPRTRTRNATMVVLLVASLIVSFSDVPGLRTLLAAVSTTTVPLERPALRLGRWAGLLPRLLRERTDLAEENRALHQQLGALEDRLAVLQDGLAQSRRELSAAVELSEQLQATGSRPLLADVVGLEAEVGALGADGWRQSCRLNRGSTHGVTTGQPVVWGVALVGLVEAVAPWGSVVKLTTDPESRIWCYDARSGAQAVAVGSGRDELRLLHADWQADIASGDVFLTTGKAGRFPPALVVGVVKEVRREHSGLEGEVCLRPRVTVQEVRSVFLLPVPPPLSGTGPAPG